MLLSIINIEKTKLFHRKALWVELALIAGLIVMVFGLVIGVQNSTEIPEAEKALIAETLTLPDGITIALALASKQGLGALMMIVLVSMVVAQEYAWQTYTLAVRAGIPRATVLIGKFVLLLLPAFLLVLTALVVGTLMSGLLTVAIEGNLNLSRVNVADLLLAALATAYSLLPYMSLTFLVAVLTRSLAASIGIAAGYVFIIEGIVPGLLLFLGGLPAQLAMLMPGQFATSLLGASGQIAAMESMSEGAGTAPVFPMADPVVAVVGIALYTIGFLAVAVWWFQKQDLTA